MGAAHLQEHDKVSILNNAVVLIDSVHTGGAEVEF